MPCGFVVQPRTTVLLNKEFVCVANNGYVGVVHGIVRMCSAFYVEVMYATSVLCNAMCWIATPRNEPTRVAMAPMESSLGNVLCCNTMQCDPALLL